MCQAVGTPCLTVPHACCPVPLRTEPPKTHLGLSLTQQPEMFLEHIASHIVPLLKIPTDLDSWRPSHPQETKLPTASNLAAAHPPPHTPPGAALQPPWPPFSPDTTPAAVSTLSPPQSSSFTILPSSAPASLPLYCPPPSTLCFLRDELYCATRPAGRGGPRHGRHVNICPLRNE